MIGTRTGGRSRRRLGLALFTAAVTAVTGVFVTADTAGAKTPAHLPYGAVQSVTQISARYYQVVGWAVDNDSTRSLRVTVRVDGRNAVGATANKTTPAVPASYGKHGAKHGFTLNVRVPYGTHRICVIAANAGPGHARQIGCRTRVHENNPEGSLSTVAQAAGGKVRVAGTAWDPNTKTPVKVTITANGKALGPVVVANGGSAHRGFTSTQPLAEGSYTICAVAANLRWGLNTSVGCRKITLNYGPVGAITAITQISGGAKISGWATDPDSSGPVTVTLYDGAPASGTLLGTVVADVPNGKIKPNHQFTVRYTGLAQGTHTFCAVGTNIGPGEDRQLACRTATLNFNPTATITSLTQTMTGAKIAGTAIDPDTTDPVPVTFTVDGAAAGSGTTANLGSGGHSFAATLAADNGPHKVCVVAQNLQAGTSNTTTCRTITLKYAPLGTVQPLTRSTADAGQLIVSGWALDQGAKNPVTVTATLDKGTPGTPVTAGGTTPATPSTYTATFGTAHGFSFTVAADSGEHTVCLTATNPDTGNGAGLQTSLGCQLIVAVNPVKPSAPQNVTAAGGYGGAQVSWTPPADDGGAPPSSYTVTSSPGNIRTTVTIAQASPTPPSTAPVTATVVGLKPKTSYTFTVVATNTAGTSPSARSAAVVTQASPPPQTSPAPVSTSRYIRNISSGSAAEQATMRTEGATDASYNPSGHGYLILLDIGGQDSYDGGVVLSATTRFVTYSALVADLKAYVDGYATGQKPSAPVVIAIGTNNDMDVTKAAGADWANKVVDPVVSYAAKYSGVTIAGANDVEPGFRGTYSQSRAWLTGYLAATKAPFVFNGSADGCSWTAPAKGCNNGWTMAGLYQLAGGLAPTRIVNLPQIYNTTMPKQWKYISLTGVNAGSPRINFGGPLTEWTACDQAGGCGSITGVNAWQQLWTQLQSAAQLKVGSLPYSTDLRIDK